MKHFFLLFSLMIFGTGVASTSLYAQSEKTKGKSKPPSQEQLDEKELEAKYGTKVDRDTLDRGAFSTETRDRVGEGRVTLYQENTQSYRNLDTSDTVGVEFKLFEFN